ncbi:hypothetical protein DNTS_009621 [Danionella cerebrum]|uniref:THAP-type domain-containing protein n=1 Tax=Danionella cerebrum TaxID=2873325 RepID=A0A553PZ42_9TELE|nr:hypothetical protein DNTS_009621 [Danionella translucida]
MATRRCMFGCQGESPLFTLPKDKTLRQKWLDFIFGANPPPKKVCYVCTRHFTDDCFLNKSLFDTGLISRLSLKDRAIPSLKSTPSEPAKKEDLLHDLLEMENEKNFASEECKYSIKMLRKRAREESPSPELENTAAATPTFRCSEPDQNTELLDPAAKRPCCCQTYSKILSFLERRFEAEHCLREEEMTLRREELEVQRSKIALEQERFGAEKLERERRFELESQERQVILDLLKEKVLKKEQN